MELGRGRQARKLKGAYKQMHEGLTTAIAKFDDPDPEPPISDMDWLPELLAQFALAAITSTTPRTLDEALRSPNANKWQAALDYEVGQLEKLKTWVIEDLPKGQTAIPCTEVLKEKLGPSSEVETFRV